MKAKVVSGGPNAEIEIPGGRGVLILRVSRLSMIRRSVVMRNLTMSQVQAWRQGALIQDVAPQLTDDEREFIISGVTPGEWEDLLGEEV